MKLSSRENGIRYFLILLTGLFFSVGFADAKQNFTETPLNSPVIYRLFDEGDRLWIGTLDGFNVFSRSRNRFLSLKVQPLSSKKITCIEKFDRTIWFGTSGDGIYKIQGGEFIHYGLKNSGILSNHVNDLEVIRTEEGEEVLIIATAEGISVLDSKSDWGGFSIHDGLQSNNVKGLQKTSEYGKTLVFGDCGLQLLDCRTGKIKIILSDVRVSCVRKWMDKWWVGTVSKGVIRFDSGWKKFDTLDGENSGLKSRSVLQMEKTEKELLFLTPDGIFSYNRVYWKTELQGRKFSNATDFKVGKDRFFIATSGSGLFICEKELPGKVDILGTLVKKSNQPFYQRWKTLDKPFKGARINDVAVKYITLTKSVNIYAATSRGFFEILDDGRKIKRYYKDNSIFETDQIKKIAFKNYPYSGQFVMFLATYGKGLYRYDGKKWEHIGKNDGLLSNYIHSADYIPKKNEFWFGTTNGINRYNEQSWKGFYNLNINLFQKVKRTCFFEGKYYFATDFGIGVFDGRKWSKIGLKEGLNDMVVTELSAGSGNKNLYIGTQHGGLYRWNGKNVLNMPLNTGRKSLLGFKEIKSICLHNGLIYVTFKNDLIQIESRRQKSLKKNWGLPEGTLRKVIFYDQYIFIIYDYKILFTKYHKWEKL